MKKLKLITICILILLVLTMFESVGVFAFWPFGGSTTTTSSPSSLDESCSDCTGGKKYWDKRQGECRTSGSKDKYDNYDVYFGEGTTANCCEIGSGWFALFSKEKFQRMIGDTPSKYKINFDMPMIAACCSSDSACSDINGNCIRHKRSGKLSDQDVNDKIAYCRDNKWRDCDYSSSYCSVCSGTNDVNLYWAKSGEGYLQEHGEYWSATNGGKNAAQGVECCGDDRGEYYINIGCDGNQVSQSLSRCCDKSTDKIQNGECVSGCVACDCSVEGECHATIPGKICDKCNYIDATDSEICDGLDNDCVGGIDNGLTPPPASKQEGVCQGSVKICDGVNNWKEPDYTAIQGYSETENCDDDIDNNCIGGVNEECNVIPELDDIDVADDDDQGQTSTDSAQKKIKRVRGDTEIEIEAKGVDDNNKDELEFICNDKKDAKNINFGKFRKGSSKFKSGKYSKLRSKFRVPKETQNPSDDRKLTYYCWVKNKRGKLSQPKEIEVIVDSKAPVLSIKSKAKNLKKLKKKIKQTK